ncbi:MAG: hypothetical protein ACREI1_11110, partial [Nitrospiraceae bacterium]
ALIEAVRKGRRAEFASFAWEGEVPDPQNPDTFEHSRVHPGIQTLVENNQILRWYHRLIKLRKSIPALESAQSGQHEHRVWIEESKQVLFLHRTVHRTPAALIILSFNREPILACLQEPFGAWELMVDSLDVEFGGSGLNRFPATMVIGLKGQTISVPAYGVAVYQDRTPSA